MSEPKRYHFYAGLDVHAFAKAEAVLKFSVEDDGMWVMWEDYARLKAEVERLRLIGDEIIMDVYRSECLTDKWCKMARKWNAAKEGKQP